jgi:hypothetical protein
LIGTIATVSVAFSLPVLFDLDDLSSLANLRPLGAATVSAKVSPNVAGLLIAGVVGAIAAGVVIAIGGGLVGWIVGGLVAVMWPIVAVIAAVLLIIACDAVNYVLKNAIRTVLQGASLLRSPVAIPPGLLEAFGRLSPVTVSVDDLTANSVLHTPTSPWAVLPKIGPRRRPPKTPPPPKPPRDRGDKQPKSPNAGERRGSSRK